ncbi:ABC transporter permease [Staphylococcus simulans]|uniref:FtsX-like permease family protein n=1 Tax=Staphylococcus simulans TaxID=1286 RepID=UPI0004CEDD86|nr:ABC transporter permease [Staphylococcus simulans]MCE5148781.1 ABC transporter permease [Staphylococcus simulans]PTJ33477.1 ABC transporter permease [Staphylococcus simulans]
MTFRHIVLKNLRQNIRHYGLYLFSLIMSISLYFSFVTLKYTETINNSESSKLIQKGASLGSVVLFIIIIIFLMYVNQLFIKQRDKELGLYQLIGLTKANVVRMSMLEQFAIFVVTGLVGIVVGLVGSRILLLIVTKLMQMNETVHLHFSLKAVGATALMLVIAYILVIVQNAIFIKRRSILGLMQTRRTADVKSNKITVLEAISGIVGLAMIISGYVMAVDTKLLANMAIPFLILFLTIVGAYLFFRSTVSLLFKTLKKRKKGQVSINDVIFTSSIMHRMKKNALSLTIIAVISAITVTVLCFSAIQMKMEKVQLNTFSPYDVTLQSKHDVDLYEKALKKHHIDYDLNYKELLMVQSQKNNLFKKNVGYEIGIRVTSEKYVENAGLSDHTAKLSHPFGTGMLLKPITNDSYVAFQDKQGQQLFRVKVQDTELDTRFSLLTLRGGVLVIVNDEDYRLLKEKGQIDKDDLSPQYGFTITDKSQMKEASKALDEVDPGYETKEEIAKDNRENNGMFLFISSFLGIAFLIAAGCIIYIKQMDETTDEIGNFKILRKLGYTQNDMRHGLKLKIMFNFGLPLIVGLAHAYFASWAFLNLMGSDDHSPVFIVMGVYTLIYASFAIIAYIHTKRTIKQSI